jgi:cysteine desulfurase
MALHCALRDLEVKHIITSPIEHHAVLHTVEALALDHDNVHFSLVRLTDNGHVDLDHLEELLRSSTEKTMVSLMHANNEIGNLLPLEKVSIMCRNYDAYFHSDTVQTMGHYTFNMKELDVDFITCAAHKLHGPKGVGFLYINNNLNTSGFIHGGAQERGLRGGTENIYGIVGLAKALELANESIAEHQNHVQGLKSYMIEELSNKLVNVSFHGDTSPTTSLYTVLNVCLPSTPKASMILFTLDLKGVACSGGSACSSGSNKGSHVLSAIHADASRPNARFSFSRFTTKEEIDYAVQTIVEMYETQLV